MREMRKTWAAVLAAVLLLTLAATFAFPQGRQDTTRSDLTRDFLVDVALGRVPKHTVFHKFGSALATTTLSPVTRSGNYRTPTAPVALEILSDDVNDDAVGTGAQEVTIYGLGAGWTEVVQVVELDGTTPVAIPTSLLRVYRWRVSRSGSYADQVTPSQVGTLTIRVAGAGDIWSTIPPIAGLGAGQSRIGVLTVPAGVTAYVVSYSATVDSTKTVSAYLFQRDFADDVTTPYTGTFRIVRELIGLSGPWAPDFQIPEGPFVGPCDLGFMAMVAVTSGDITVDFEVLYIED